MKEALSAKSPAERKRDERKRKADAGLLEVRGIYAKADNHPKIKKYAARLKLSD